jgi:hypothetical protein
VSYLEAMKTSVSSPTYVDTVFTFQPDMLGTIHCPGVEFRLLSSVLSALNFNFNVSAHFNRDIFVLENSGFSLYSYSVLPALNLNFNPTYQPLFCTQR